MALQVFSLLMIIQVFSTFQIDIDIPRQFFHSFTYMMDSTCHQVSTSSNSPRKANFDISRLDLRCNEQRLLQARHQAQIRLLSLIVSSSHSLSYHSPHKLHTVCLAKHTHTQNILLAENIHQNTPLELSKEFLRKDKPPPHLH